MKRPHRHERANTRTLEASRRENGNPLEARTRLRIESEGRLARYADRGKSACPYHDKAMKQAWADGWVEMDTYLKEMETEQ